MRIPLLIRIPGQNSYAMALEWLRLSPKHDRALNTVYRFLTGK